MVRSVTFPENGTGYIYEKVEKPTKPLKTDPRYYNHQDRYESDIEEYKKEMAYYRKNKGKYILKCSENLVGKTFSFEDKKINMIFGPNGSGKTTIIKAIAGQMMCADGFTSFCEPLEFGCFGRDRTIDEIIEKKKRNTSVVDMDVIPVYYDNFEYTRTHSTGYLGDMMGSIINNIGDELAYMMNSNKISSGQHSLFVLNRIIEIAKKEVSMDDIVNVGLYKFFHGNSTWQNAGKYQKDYFSKLENYKKKSHPVLLFDEIDKSLDIEAVWALYTDFFPKVIEKWGNQIIMVSHNPLILSENIFNNDKYNIISVDPCYTDHVKSMLKGTKF